MVHDKYAAQCEKALNELLDYFGGNKSQMAAACGVTRNCVSFWFSKKHIGRETALAIDMNPHIPFTKEQLRPDIKVWSIYRQPALA